MMKNMGTAARVVRLIVAIGIAALYLMGSVSGVVAIVLGVVAVVFLATGIIGYCPGYVPLGISTRKASVDSVRV
jgi:hypothetical protein